MDQRRMYRVIVLGGVSLVATATVTTITACGHGASEAPDGSGVFPDGFPSELPSYTEASIKDTGSDAADASDASDAADAARDGDAAGDQ